VAGAGDVPANALGLGAVVPGTAFTILGTNCQSCLVYDHPIFEPAEVGLLFYVPGGRWFKALMNVAGTTNLDWAVAQFCGEERAQAQSRDDLYRRVEALAANSPIGANGVMYHPYLGTAGVIAPFVEPTARAQFLGLHGGHTRADLLRAVYEGVALAIRDCYAALTTPISRILFAGGGSRSPLWAQMIADCLGAEVALPVGREFGAKGAALLAGVGVGVFADVIAASQGAAEVARVFTPRDSFTSAYEAVFERYRDGRRLALPLWHRLNA
jgi:sugar (pentulose or hexulose) kinase